LIEADRSSHLISVYAPSRPVTGIRAKLELPLGVPERDREVWLPVQAPLTLSLLIERDSVKPLSAEVRLIVPAGVRVEEAGERGWTAMRQGESLVLARNETLRDRKQFLLNVSLEEVGRPLTLQARIAASNAPPVTVEMHVRGADVQEVQRLVRLPASLLPTNRHGEFDATQRADVLQLPTPFGRFLRKKLGGQPSPVGDDHPFCYQSAQVVNKSSTAIAIETRSWVCDADGRVPLPHFAPPRVVGKIASYVSAPALVPSDSSARIVLPVYVRPDTLPGEYRRDVQVRLLGTDAVLASLSVPLRVERTDRPAFFVALLAAIVTLLALPLLAWFGPRLLRRFAAVELIQIALFASAAFLLAVIPSRLLATLVNVLIPMFSPFLLGLYGQVVGLAVLGALVVLVPRPGVVLLAGVTRFLLNGIFFGAFSPVDFLYVIPVLLVGEACLWLVGVTRSPDTPVTALQLAPACALMGVAAAGLQLSLEMSLYRLFFADWYVFLFLALDGALYPALGALLGVRLGVALKRTAE
jgi:hypothetical protein